MKLIYSSLIISLSWAITLAQFEREVLNSHNLYREKHGVPPVALDDSISKWAQEWANHIATSGKFEHRTDDPYGENLYGTTGEPTGSEVVDSFYDEIYDYNYDSPHTSKDTKHFTQLVWRDSKLIGVGKATATDGWTYVVINYYPPGNYLYQYDANVPLPLY